MAAAMPSERLVIGTRGSRLALRQAELIASSLRSLYPRLEVELAVIQTKGDLVLDRALSRIGDKGLFVTEIENALLERRVDLAVHSCKDLPSAIPTGLVLAAFPARADARDALVSRHGLTLAALPHGARIGTSSLRRGCQLRAYRPDFEVLNLRGNVDTRLRKGATDDYDGIVLAAAGLERLGLAGSVTEYLPPETMLPAVAQGALALECRANDERVAALLRPLDDAATRAAVQAERAFLRRLEGGCQVPIAAYAVLEGFAANAPTPRIHLRGLVGTADGMHIVRGEREAPAGSAQELGRDLAEELLRAGADEILQRLSRVVPAAVAPEEA